MVIDGKNPTAIKTFNYYANCPYGEDPQAACAPGTFPVVGAGGNQGILNEDIFSSAKVLLSIFSIFTRLYDLKNVHRI